MPQGSASGANLFIAYCASLQDVIRDPIELFGFADDHFMGGSYPASSRAKEIKLRSDLEDSMQRVETWMSTMQLKLNPDKTEFILFGHPRQIIKSTVENINVSGTPIVKSDCVRCLGAHLDTSLNFKIHVNKKCQAAMLQLRRIKSIRKCLTQASCESFCISLVISQLDYCNVILLGAPKSLLRKLQRIQTMAAKLVLLRTKYDSGSECLRQLHWLPIVARIEFKACLMIHHCIHGTAPIYLKKLFVLKSQPARTLRSASNSDYELEVSFTKYKTFADRSISVGGAKLWNGLSKELRVQKSTNNFKSLLKTYLFDKYLNT